MSDQWLFKSEREAPSTFTGSEVHGDHPWLAALK